MSEVIVFATIVFGGLFVWLALNRKQVVHYRKKRLLTGPEQEFFYRLRQALPDCVICPRIAVSALIEPSGTGLIRKSGRDNIKGKKVGYAVFDEQMQLLVVVELDHRSRPSRSAVARDAFFAEAGIRTVRFAARRLPSAAKIHDSIYSAVAGSRRARCPDMKRAMADIKYVRPETPWRNTANAHI
ncbi:MAG TPA: DUF2726 domain-containing protein [Noviherbaspirillum sp.]|nr:DUF2726 domain-containing protein [Noviherbaspirillum sp.]